jgi:hypothetical protein
MPLITTFKTYFFDNTIELYDNYYDLLSSCNGVDDNGNINLDNLYCVELTVRDEYIDTLTDKKKVRYIHLCGITLDDCFEGFIILKNRFKYDFNEHKYSLVYECDKIIFDEYINNLKIDDYKIISGEQ